MISILSGFVIISGIFQLMYWTGRLSGKWATDRDVIDEKSYISKGFVIWFVLAILLIFFYIVGKVTMYFI